jgi:hypothetical protein
MGYLSSSASVSSSYSASRGVQFKDRHDVLASMALDNKYLKRRSQMERQRLHDMESSICGVGDISCCASLNHPPVLQRNRKYRTFLLVVLGLSLCSILFLAGWLSANYTSFTTTSEEKSLEDLAESIRRMRLRRQKSTQLVDTGSQDQDEALQVDRPPPKRLGHRYYNDRDPPEPPDEFELLKNSEVEAKRLEELEKRIRATQDRQVTNELKEKRMEDKMAESIQALKAFAYKATAQKEKELEQESFQENFKSRRKISNK